MGGSGGNFFYQGDSSPEEISKKIRSQEEKAKDDSYDAQVSSLLKDSLAYINYRDTDSIQRYLNTIEKAIEKDIEGTIDLRYGGSIAKHTYVDGLSDVDSLVIINKSELINSTPNEVKQFFYEALKKRLPNSDIHNGRFAVTIKYSNGTEIQLLPAIKTADGIKIASSRNTEQWSKIFKPEVFAKSLRYMNVKMNGKLIPVIKLAKTVIATLPENRRLSGYHTECLAIEVFNKYNGIKSPKEMLKHFFNESSKSVLTPMKDKTGQSIYVDDYLKESNSLNRKMVSDSLSSLSRRMHNADGSKNLNIWQNILE